MADLIEKRSPQERLIIAKTLIESVLQELPCRKPEMVQNVSDTDLISRKAAIDALWKALYEYEDKTEKQFQESEDLDVGDWIVHRGFVQNMSDIDRQTIRNLPSAQPEIVRCKDCKYGSPNGEYGCRVYHFKLYEKHEMNADDFCSRAERREE